MPFCSNCGHENPVGAQFCATCGQASVAGSGPQPVPEAGAKRRYRAWVVGAIAFAAIVGAGVATATILQINALTRNAVISVVPDDAEIYVEIDLLEVSEENLQDIVDAYSDPFDEADIELDEVDDFYTLFDDYLHDEFRMTVEDDVMPWIGRHIAAAAFDTVPSTRDYDWKEDWLAAWAIPWGDAEGDMLLVIQVRDADLADAFLEDLADAYQDQGWVVDDRRIGGLDFYEVSDWIYEDSDHWNSGDLLFGRSGDVVLASGSIRLVQDALETQAGERQSIVDAEGFQTAMGGLPKDVLIRGYWSEAGVKEFSAAFGRLEDLDGDGAEALGVVTMAGWFTDSGFRSTSSVAVDTAKLPEDAVTWLDQLNESDPLAAMPEGRVYYYAFPGSNLLLSAYCELTGNEWDCDEARDRRDLRSVGTTTLADDPSWLVDMETFTDAAAARRAVTEEATRGDGSVMILDRDGSNLWIDMPEGTDWYYADATTGSTGWSWSEPARSQNQRESEAVAEFELLESHPRFQVPPDAVASLGEGSVPLFFFDGPAAAHQLETSESERDRDDAELLLPIRWLVAGLNWDGTHLHASAAVEWDNRTQDTPNG